VASSGAQGGSNPSGTAINARSSERRQAASAAAQPHKAMAWWWWQGVPTFFPRSILMYRRVG